MMINSSSALRVQTEMTKTASAISRSLERLGSGRRVNSPKDDVGAYSMGVTFDSQIRGMTQANLNINSSLGMIEVADAGFESQLSVLQRMREIAVEASSSTLTSTDRSNLNKELQGLLEEYRRIASDTEYNGTSLIDGSFTTTSIQVGAYQDQTVDLNFQSGRASDVITKTAGNGTWNSRTTALVGNDPNNLEQADLNNDGFIDLVVSNEQDDQVSVLLGAGNGTFQTQRTFAIGDQGAAQLGGLTLGDVNGDGIVDIVAADVGTDDSVSILIGNGDGTFQSRFTLATGGDPAAIRIADFNNDGLNDIATGDSVGTTVSIFLNQGSNVFSSRLTAAAGAVRDMVVGDFNNDGYQDVITANASTSATVLLGNGNGTFVNGTTLTVGTAARGVVAGDWNNDGKMDLAFANSGTTSVSTFLNLGVASFTSGGTLTTGTAPEDIETADLNNDGLLDLVTIDEDSLRVSTYYGQGNGQWTTGTTLTTGGAATNGGFAIALADFNEDGVIDIASFDYINATGNTVGIFLQQTRISSAEADVNVLTQAKSQNLITYLDNAIANINENRVRIAALHNRLEETAAYNLLVQENIVDAQSAVLDTDVAFETAELVKNQVLQQAQVAVAAQANLQMQTVLGLLRN